MTRDEIITRMCYTWRHDYGLEKSERDMGAGLIVSGMTRHERDILWRQMTQLYNNCVEPYMEFKDAR